MSRKNLASMTGFGRAGGRLSDRLHASIVVRGVNHRYLDVQVRTNIRDEMPELETAARSAVAKAVKRGRINVQVNLQRTAPGASNVLVNPEAIASVLGQLESLHDSGAAEAIGVRDILSLPGMISVSGDELVLDDDETAALAVLLDEATAAFVAMRRSEAEHLLNQIRTELGNLREFAAWFEPQMHGFRERLLERLKERIRELVGTSVTLDDDRLFQEAAQAADRADVAEEIVRLISHLDTFDKRLAGGGAVGRALDFVCQEINRELNTLGSKCRELGIAERLVDAKTATERIREQIQNLE